jgi:15-cis-phytoene desaturase
MDERNDERAPERADVVIVGGGLAGLTCAVGLCDAGLDVVVLERDRELGGRARSWTDSRTGDPVHIGPHILLDPYPNMFRLLDLLGTRDKIVWQQGRRFLTLVQGRREIPIDHDRRLSPPHNFVPSLLRIPGVGLRDILSNRQTVSTALHLDEEGVRRLDALDGLTCLRALGVRESFIARFWAFLSIALLNAPLERCSAGALFRLYRFLIGHPHLRIGFPDGGLADLFVPGARARIESRGGRVRTGVEVSSFLAPAGREPEAGGDGGNGGDRVGGVELADGRRIEARFVVAALPPQALARLAPAAWSERHPLFAALPSFRAVPYVSVFLWFDRKLSRRQFWARTYAPDDLNCDFYDFSNINSGWAERPSLIGSNIIASDRVSARSDDELVAGTLGELAELLPAAGTSRLVHQVVNRIPMAIHEPSPGTEALRPASRTSVAGLFVAGDWIRTTYPASMESAVAAGWLAADEVLRAAGRVSALALPAAPVFEAVSPLFRWSERWLPRRNLFAAAGRS